MQKVPGTPETLSLQDAALMFLSAGSICPLPQTWGALQKGLSPEQAVAYFQSCNLRIHKYLLLS